MSRPRMLLMSNHVDGLGGAERSVHAVAAGLFARGYDVCVTGVRPAADHGRDLSHLPYATGFLSPRREAAEGEPPLPTAVRRGMREEAVQRLRELLDDYRDGVVVCAQVFTMEHFATIGIEDVLASGTRIVGQYHSSFEAAKVSNDLPRLSATYRQLDRFLLLTEPDATAFRRLGYNNTGVMPNALPFNPDVVQGPDERPNTVVAVARYDTVKQLDHALRAWARIHPEFPDWSFELYGDGPERAALEALVDELGLGGSVRLMGVTDDVEGVLARARLSVLCSRWEGLPMVLAEAMACGVPVVSYDCSPGVRDIVTDGDDGLVVRQDDVAGLASAMARVMRDEQLQARFAQRARVSVQRFSSDAVMDRWERLIARVVR